MRNVGFARIASLKSKREFGARKVPESERFACRPNGGEFAEESRGQGKSDQSESCASLASPKRRRVPACRLAPSRLECDPTAATRREQTLQIILGPRTPRQATHSLSQLLASSSPSPSTTLTSSHPTSSLHPPINMTGRELSLNTSPPIHATCTLTRRYRRKGRQGTRQGRSQAPPQDSS